MARLHFLFASHLVLIIFLGQKRSVRENRPIGKEVKADSGSNLIQEDIRAPGSGVALP